MKTFVTLLAAVAAIAIAGSAAAQSAAPTLQQFLIEREIKGAGLVLANVNEQPLSLMRRSGFADAIGEESIVPTVAAAFDDQPSR